MAPKVRYLIWRPRVQRHGLGREYHGETARRNLALKLPDMQETKRLSEEKIKDILLMVTYSGTTPEWPI